MMLLLKYMLYFSDKLKNELNGIFSNLRILKFLMSLILFSSQVAHASGSELWVGLASIACMAQDAEYLSSPSLNKMETKSQQQIRDVVKTIQENMAKCPTNGLVNQLPKTLCDVVTANDGMGKQEISNLHEQYASTIQGLDTLGKCAASDINMPKSDGAMKATPLAEGPVYAEPDLSQGLKAEQVLQWRKYVEQYIQQYKPPEIQGEPEIAFVLQHPAMHAFETILDIGYQFKGQAWLVTAMPSKKQVTFRKLAPKLFSSFVNRVSGWKDGKWLSYKGISGIDEHTRPLIEGFLGLLSVRGSSGTSDLPLRGWELLGIPENIPSPRLSRLQTALAELQGNNVTKLEQSAENELIDRKIRTETDGLWVAIRDDDAVAFAKRLVEREYLKLDSQDGYNLLFWAIGNDRIDMAVSLLNAGQPLTYGKSVHPGLMGEFLRANEFSNLREGAEQLKAKLKRVTNQVKLRDERQFWQSLDVGINNAIENIGRQNRLAATRESMAQEIESNPQIGFAASISDEALKLAVEGKHKLMNFRNAKGETVLFYALRDEKQCETAIKLVRDGADVHTPNQSYGVTPLMLAAGNCTNDTVKLILQKHVDVNVVSQDNSSALLFAASAGRTDNVRQLLAARANSSMADKSGMSPLLAAERQGFSDVAQLLQPK